MSDLQTVSMDLIRPSEHLLRPLDKESEDYRGLRDAIKQGGFNSTLLARKILGDEGQELFEIVDGWHRFNAAQEVGLTELPLQVKEMTDDEVLTQQAVLNLHRVETKPHEFARRMVEIARRHPLMTKQDMATMFSKSTAWVDQRLKLGKIISEDVIDLIDRGEINVSAACALARLPVGDHVDYAARALALNGADFETAVSERIREVNKLRRQGADAASEDWKPVAHLRNLREIKEVLDDGNKEFATAVVAKQNLNPVDAFLMGLYWTVRLDPETVSERQAEYDAKQAEAEKKKAESAVEKARLKAIRQDINSKLAQMAQTNAEEEFAGRKQPHDIKAERARLEADLLPKTDD